MSSSPAAQNSPDPPSSAREISRHMTLRGMLVVTTVFAALLAMALRFESPALPVSCMIVGIGSLAWKICRPSITGTILSVLAAEAGLGAAVSYFHDPGWPSLTLSVKFWTGGAASLAVAALVVFVVASFSRRPGAGRNLAAAIVAAAISLVAALLGPPCLLEWQSQSLTKRLTEDGITVQKLFHEVTELSESLGRSPVDEAELVRLLRRPMPVVHKFPVGTVAVEYERIGTSYFRLSSTDSWLSSQPASDGQTPGNPALSQAAGQAQPTEE